MDSHCISFRRIPRTSALFLDYLYNFDRVAEFYSWNPHSEESYRAAAASVSMDAARRENLCRALEQQNRGFGGGDACMENIRRLRDSGTVAVVTGQQVGLFGGPSYTVYKALTAIRLAADLSAKGVPAVPVFWMASYDHDFAEVSRTQALNGHCDLIPLEDTARPPRDAPVGEVRFGGNVRALRGKLQRLWHGESGGEAGELLRGYEEGQTYAAAFGTLLQSLFSGQGLIVMDPRGKGLQRLAKPLYQKMLAEGPDLIPALESRAKTLRERGYHAQVDVRDDSTLLFLELDGKRKLLRRSGAAYVLAGRVELSPGEVEEKLEASPQQFSPSALLRPVVQDWLLPTVAYVGGPAEVAYLAQSSCLYERLLGRMPVVVPRASITLIEPRVERLLRKYGFAPEDIWAPYERLRGRVAAARVPRRLAGKLERTEKKFVEMLESTRAAVEGLDSTLAGAVETSRRKMLYQFEKIRGKAARAQAEQNGIVDRHARLLHNSLYPGRALQERQVNFLSFVARYGRSLVPRLLEGKDLLSPDHQVIRL